MGNDGWNFLLSIVVSNFSIGIQKCSNWRANAAKFVSVPGGRNAGRNDFIVENVSKRAVWRLKNEKVLLKSDKYMCIIVYKHTLLKNKFVVEFVGNL